jgi:hypothetical protein
VSVNQVIYQFVVIVCQRASRETRFLPLEQLSPVGCIPVSQIAPTLREEQALHPPAPSPTGGEGDPDRKSLSRSGLPLIHKSSG